MSKVPGDKLKREASSSSLAVPPSKKLKVGLAGVSRSGIVGTSSASLLPIDRMTGGSSGTEPWESLAIECDVADVFDKLTQNAYADNTDRIVSALRYKSVYDKQDWIYYLIESIFFNSCLIKTHYHRVKSVERFSDNKQKIPRIFDSIFRQR